MTMRDISRRLDRLNTGRLIGARRVIRLLAAEADEPVATAISRWCAAHPDEPPPVEDDLIILRTLVAPK